MSDVTEKAIVLIKKGKPVSFIVKHLNIPERTVYNLRKELGIIKTTSYSDVEKELILNNYKTHGNKKISELLKEYGYTRTPNAISKWIGVNGYRRTKEELSSILSENTEGNIYFSSQNPSFKKEGTISIKRNGNLKFKIIKIDGKWIRLHRYLWQQEHGSIPRNSHIYFINGDTLDCRIENLSLKHPNRRRKERARKSLQQYVINQDNSVNEATIKRKKQIDKANAALYEYEKRKVMKQRKKKSKKKVHKKQQKKSPLQIKKEKLDAMSPIERGKYYHQETKGMVRVVDRDNKLTKLVSQKVYEEKYKNK